MMPSGQAHPNYQAQHVSDYQSSDYQNSDYQNANLQNANHQHQILAHHTPPLDTLGALGTPNLSEFEFPYGIVAPGSVTPNGMDLDNTSNLFNTRPSIEHRNSLSSISSMPRNQHGSKSRPAKRHRSCSGASEASSIHNGLNGFDTGNTTLGDDFGMNIGGPRAGSEDKRADKNERPPEWTELKTKAGKDRKRLPLACSTCRRKKIRCSGEKPACKRCITSKTCCIYKGTTKKAAARTDYMVMVDKRIKRMETRIMNIVPKKEQTGTLSVIRANVKPPIPGTLPSKTSTRKKRLAEEAFGAELDSWSKSTSKDPNGDGDGNGNEIENQASKSITLQAQEEEESKLLKEGAEKLPSREIQEHLAEVFFESIYGQTYHLLHKPSFMMKLKAGELPPVLVLAVCACAARFSNHIQLDTEPAYLRGEEWASEARDITMKRYDWPNITILTCLLILSLHAFGTCSGGKSWALCGIAIRMAHALQLHKDLDYDPVKLTLDDDGNPTKLSFIDREIRRRTMWACFLMDRFESSGNGRPTFTKEEDLEIQLPVKEDMFLLDVPGPTEHLYGEVTRPIKRSASGEKSDDPKQNMGVAAYVIRSIAIYSNVVTYFNHGGIKRDPYPMWHPESKYSSLVKQYKDFQDSIPLDMAYNHENLYSHKTNRLANQFILLHIVIQQIALFISRFAVHLEPNGPLANAPKDYVTILAAKAMKAAGSIAQLIDDGESHSITAPFIGYCAFSASTVLTFGAFSKNSALVESSKKNLTHTVKYLQTMKNYWGPFHWMSENLKKQYKACADGNIAGFVFPQYGDWIEKFPHGISQSEYEDPAMAVKKEKGDDAVLEQKSNLGTVEKYIQDLPTPRQRQQPNPKPRQKFRRTQSSSQPLRPPQIDPIQTMPSNIQTSHLRMQVPTPSSSHAQIPTQQAPQNPFNQDIMSPTALQLFNHRELLMPPQQPRNMAQQQMFNSYSGIDRSAMNGNGMNCNGMNHNGINGNGMNGSINGSINSSMNGNMNGNGTPGPSHNGGETGINWAEIGGLGGMGNLFDPLSLDPGDHSTWYTPFNMPPPDLTMGEGMNGGDTFGDAAYGREFEMRNGDQGMLGMDMSGVTGVNGVNGHGGMGGL